MQQLGTIDVSYNKNSKILYARFTPVIKTTVRCEINLTDEKELLDCLQQSVAKWFNVVSEVELSPSFESEIKFKDTDEKTYFKTGELKTMKISVELG